MLFDPAAHPLHVAEEGGHTSVRFPDGTALTEANSDAVGARLAQLAEARPGGQLTLDLGGVTMLASLALAKLVSLHGKVRAAGGRLALVNATPGVRQVFRVTRLDTLLDIRTPEAMSA